MSKSTPSLLALLGLVAFAGYQNRGRISEMLSDATRENGMQPTNSAGGFLSDISQRLQSGLAGNGIGAALGDLVAQFRSSGQAEAAESWVSTDANRPMNVDEMEAALGAETIDELSQKTGLPRAELLLRLNAALPDVVNRLTPDGRLPNPDETQSFL